MAALDAVDPRWGSGVDPVIPDAATQAGDKPHKEAVHGRTSLVDRLFALRNRLLASPRFQLWASSFPLTRTIARRRAQDLFDLCAGFVYSQVLQACVRLKLFDALLDGPQTLEQLGTQLSLSLQASTSLFEAAGRLDCWNAGVMVDFGLGVLGAALVGNPAVTAMIEHHPLFLRRSARSRRTLTRGGKNGACASLAIRPRA